MSQSATTPSESAETEILRNEEGAVTKMQSVAIMAGSVFAGVSVFITTFIANKILHGADLNEFLMFWAALFTAYGVMSSLQQEMTRAVTNARLLNVQDGARIAWVAGCFGLLGGIVIALSSSRWAFEKMVSEPFLGISLIAIGVAVYAMQPAMSGGAAAQKSWYLYAGLAGGEAIWRLVAMLGAALFFSSLIGLEIAAVSPIFLWLVFILFSKSARNAMTARADVGWKKLSQNILLAMGSASAYSVLVMGLPLFLESSESTAADSYKKTLVAVLVLMISITRAPIMMPLVAFQGVAVTSFLKQQHRPILALMKPSAVILTMGAIGGGLAAWIGPWLFTLIYAPNTPEKVRAYEEIVNGPTLGLLTFASAVLALLVLAGTATLALNAHCLYVLGWIVAAGLTIGILYAIPLSLVPRVLLSLYFGPLTGFVVHLLGIHTLTKSRDTVTP
ncbi:MAG: hypothetical protein Q3974_00500 [Rothia sp. (in: high G+C Gram-positive bacteria)]|nr:hypothetical protein [Rothia sp. (in: high G+C Gram-positive bacteria)]